MHKYLSCCMPSEMPEYFCGYFRIQACISRSPHRPRKSRTSLLDQEALAEVWRSHICVVTIACLPTWASRKRGISKTCWQFQRGWHAFGHSDPWTTDFRTITTVQSLDHKPPLLWRQGHFWTITGGLFLLIQVM